MSFLVPYFVLLCPVIRLLTTQLRFILRFSVNTPCLYTANCFIFWIAICQWLMLATQHNVQTSDHFWPASFSFLTDGWKPIPCAICWTLLWFSVLFQFMPNRWRITECPRRSLSPSPGSTWGSLRIKPKTCECKLIQMKSMTVLPLPALSYGQTLASFSLTIE